MSGPSTVLQKGGSIFLTVLRLTLFLDLPPAELVSPDHREDRIEAVQRDQLQGLLHMERMETRGRSLNVAHHIHPCGKTKSEQQS